MNACSQPLTHLRQLCAERGLRLTPQRLAVFEEISRACDHPSAETLHQRLRQRMPSLSLDTVYRTLALLESEGLVCRISGVSGGNAGQEAGDEGGSGDGARYDGLVDGHAHVFCRCCGRVADIPVADTGADAGNGNLAAWGRVDGCQVLFSGVCRHCLEDRPAS